MRSLIKRKLFNVLIKELLPQGLTIDELVSKESVESLLRKLRPMATNQNLRRVGPNGDGGYLIPDDLEGISGCYSPGVGNVSGFEGECANLGIDVFLADKSVDGPSEHHERFYFIKKFIGPYSDDDFITMDEWVNSTTISPAMDLLLQMDIEGAEYLSIVNMSDALLRRFRIIVVEFHSLNRLWNRDFFNLSSCAFEKLLKNHTCVHIHPNNCCGSRILHRLEIPLVAEFTFLRNDRIKSRRPQTEFPHPLDFDNTDRKHMTLPKCWYDMKEGA